MWDERDTAGLDEVVALERELEATMAGADREISILQDQLSKAEDLVEDLRADVATAEKERDEAQAELDQAREELAEAQDELATLRQDQARAEERDNEQLADLRSQVLLLESQLDESRAVAREAQDRVVDLSGLAHDYQRARQAEAEAAQDREESLRPQRDWRDEY